MVADRPAIRLPYLCSFRGGAGGFLGYEVILCSASRASAGLADQQSSTKAFGAFDLDHAGAVADIALHYAFLGGQFTSAFAFIAFGG